MKLPTADQRRYQALCDAVQVCRALARGPATLIDLARSIDRSPRTARRIVTTLRRAGLDIDSGQAVGGMVVYRLDRATWLALLDLPQD
jgi:predicted DNA-binding transcriptional regulator YafY